MTFDTYVAGLPCLPVHLLVLPGQSGHDPVIPGDIGQNYSVEQRSIIEIYGT